MSKTIQLKRGTTAQNTAYTGAVGEITFDTQTKKIRVHDGSTAGGHEISGGTWGGIQGTLSNQTDLKTELDTKINLNDVGYIDCGEVSEGVFSDYTNSQIDALIAAIDSRMNTVSTYISNVNTVLSMSNMDETYIPVSEWEAQKAELVEILNYTVNAVEVTVTSGSGMVSIMRAIGYSKSFVLNANDTFKLGIGDIFTSNNVSLTNITTTTVSNGKKVTAIGTNPSIVIS